MTNPHRGGRRNPKASSPPKPLDARLPPPGVIPKVFRAVNVGQRAKTGSGSAPARPVLGSPCVLFMALGTGLENRRARPLIRRRAASSRAEHHSQPRPGCFWSSTRFSGPRIRRLNSPNLLDGRPYLAFAQSMFHYWAQLVDHTRTEGPRAKDGADVARGHRQVASCCH